MSDDKPSPGPWRWRWPEPRRDASDRGSLLDANGNAVAMTSGWPDNHRYISVMEPDARLIAAAPELLALLRDANPPGAVNAREWFDERDALLARIDGR